MANRSTASHSVRNPTTEFQLRVAGVTIIEARLQPGFFLFSIGNGLAMAGLTLAALGYASGACAAWIVALAAVGEFVILGSVSFLGDEGYQRLEARAPGFLQGGNDGTFLVTPRRRALGLALLLAHVAMSMMVWVGAVLSYTRATEVNPFPAVWGFPFDQQRRPHPGWRRRRIPPAGAILKITMESS